MVEDLNDKAKVEFKKIFSKYDPNDDGKITIGTVQFYGIMERIKQKFGMRE